MDEDGVLRMYMYDPAFEEEIDLLLAALVLLNRPGRRHRSRATTPLPTRQQRLNMGKSKAKAKKTNNFLNKAKRKPYQCIVCKRVRKCRFNIMRGDEIKHMCNAKCFENFKVKPTSYLQAGCSTPSDAPTGGDSPHYQEPPEGHEDPQRCGFCAKGITSVNYLKWLDKNYCDKDCLSSFLSKKKNNTCKMTSPKKTCASCSKDITSVKCVNWQKMDFCGQACLSSYQTKMTDMYKLTSEQKICASCSKDITAVRYINWQTMDFCGQDCLSSYQAKMTTTLNGAVANNPQLGMKIGNGIKQIMDSEGNGDQEMGLKPCHFCQKDVRGNADSFMAPVRGSIEFKDFCSLQCLKLYEELVTVDNDADVISYVKSRATSNFPTCSVCDMRCEPKHVISIDGKMSSLCGESCYAAFCVGKRITSALCANCWVESPALNVNMCKGKLFCGQECIKRYKKKSKKLVPCEWCKKKKPSLDMLERSNANNEYRLFCTFRCLSMYRVLQKASSSESVVCDQCQRSAPASYHLTMSDASVRNFCCYSCIMAFNRQFTVDPSNTAMQSGSQKSHTRTLAAKTAQFQVDTSNAVMRSGSLKSHTCTLAGNTAQFQVDTSNAVMRSGSLKSHTCTLAGNTAQLQVDTSNAAMRSGSLKSHTQILKGNTAVHTVATGSQGVTPRQGTVPLKQETPTHWKMANVTPSTTEPPVNTAKEQKAGTQFQRAFIVQPPHCKEVRNKSVSCRPFTRDQATYHGPVLHTKQTQTEPLQGLPNGGMSNGPSHKASTSFTARPTPSPRQRPLSPRVSCCPLNKAELDLYIVESDPPQSLSSNALTGSSPKMEKESKAKPRKRSLSLRGPKAEGHSPLSVKKRGLHGVSHSPTVTQEDIGSPWKRRIMPPGLGNHRDADISPFSPSLGPESLSGRYHIPTQTEGKESLKKKWRSPQAESCQWDHLDTSPANRNTPQAPGYHHNHADANPGKRNLSQVMDSYKDADVVITESYHIPESARKKNLKFCSPTTKQKERRENLRLAGAKLQCLIERVRLSPTTTPKRKLNHKS